jgi:TIR domain
MGYLSEYEHDIFVSYVHSDLLNDWSRRLIDELRRLVAGGLGLRAAEQVGIWWDYDLRGNQPLTRQLREKVEGAGVLLVLMSDWYLDSAWCRDERDWFVNTLRQRGADRVFLVRVRATDHDRWPEAFKDERGHPLAGYDFAREGNDDDLSLPKGYPRPQDSFDIKEYYEVLAKLARDIVGQLKALERAKLVPPRDLPHPALREQGDSVFLAAVPNEDVEELRDELTELLRAQGCNVVPKTNPLDPDEVYQCAPEWVSKCDKFVQILGIRYGKWKHNETGFVMYQHELAKKHRKPIFVYRSPSLDTSSIKKREYREFIEYFDQDEAGDRWSFADRVTKVAQREAAAALKEKTARGKSKIEDVAYDIFISYAQEDESIAAQIALALGNEHYTVFWDKKIPIGKDWLQFIERTITQSRCVVVLWSENSLKSRYVREEAAEAADKAKLVPLLIDKVKPPFGFRSIQAADFSDWNPRRRSGTFDYLLSSITNIINDRAN